MNIHSPKELRKKLRARACKMFGDEFAFRFVSFAGDLVRLNPKIIY